MEYWEKITGGFIAIVGGVLVVWRFLSMNKVFLTKQSHEKMCGDRLKLIRAEIKVAVLEAMNQWLEKNGHRLKK